MDITNAEFISCVVNDFSDIEVEMQAKEMFVQYTAHDKDDYVTGLYNVTVHSEEIKYSLCPFHDVAEAESAVVIHGICSVNMRLYH